MVAAALPEAGAFFAENKEAAGPLDGFPSVEMRNNETKWTAVFAGERFAIVGMCEENVRTPEVGKRDVGRVALFGDDQSMFGVRRGFDEPENIGNEDARPAIAEPAPAGDAVKVRGDLGLRKGEKFFPGEFPRRGGFTREFEVPASFVELGDAAVVKDRPFERERLARREAAFGASLVFELLAIAVEGKEGHRLLH